MEVNNLANLQGLVGASKIEQSQRLLQLRWRWGYACATLTLIAHFAAWNEIAVMFLVATTVLLTLAADLSQSMRTGGKKPEEPDDTMAEEFLLRFPDPCEHGWRTNTIWPSTFSYQEEVCYGGPPTDTETYEYAVDQKQVFARLISLLEEDLDGVTHEVAGGEVFESAIRDRKSYDGVEQHIATLKAKVLWHEISGCLRYFILSKHGCPTNFFSRERQRLEDGFSRLKREAELLGAVRGSRHYYVPMKEADETNSGAISELQSAQRLERFKISFRELHDYEQIISILDSLILDAKLPPKVLTEIKR